jgi:hypothetical protein
MYLQPLCIINPTVLERVRQGDKERADIAREKNRKRRRQ